MKMDPKHCRRGLSWCSSFPGTALDILQWARIPEPRPKPSPDNVVVVVFQSIGARLSISDHRSSLLVKLRSPSLFIELHSQQGKNASATSSSPFHPHPLLFSLDCQYDLDYLHEFTSCSGTMYDRLPNSCIMVTIGNGVQPASVCDPAPKSRYKIPSNQYGMR
jgi:hypothetical protein